MFIIKSQEAFSMHIMWKERFSGFRPVQFIIDGNDVITSDDVIFQDSNVKNHYFVQNRP